ncbi:interleukin-12 receptor subunit beta-1 [Zootoca vivipara]|uniref:interleukin-12 receptor subunit beta-1 n=1 Tax=Zootoca vivipara TaxID=8524 RepID=UPI00293B919E|nr:interleukin-12 receptor subunit beta-1 [Zootoca vivipara]
MARPRSLWRGRGVPGYSWPVAVALWFAVARVSGGDEGAPRNLKCFKACKTSRCLPQCSWEAGSQSGASYTLHFWYPDQEPGKRHTTVETGNATSLLLNRTHVYTELNVTVWVESQVGKDIPPLRSNNLTLVINQAVRLEAPKDIEFSRSRGHMTLTWSELHNCCGSSRENQVRMRPAAHVNWTTGNCETRGEHTARGTITVRCPVEGNDPYDVQVRYRTSSRYSEWSEWSQPAFVPAEILRSPELHCSAEPLGEDGQRRVTLEWEEPSREQGEVSYNLTFALLPCLCLDEAKTELVGNRTSFQAFLSGAEYNISLQAGNRVSRPPVSFCRLPAEQEAVGPTFQEVIQSGRGFSVTWGTKHEVICLEKDPGMSCEDKDMQELNETSWSGVLEPDICTRLAVHRWDPEKDTWWTLGLARLFHRRVSSGYPVRLDVTPTPTSADISWDPPALLAGCPGALQKYVLCWLDERGEEIATYELNASETRFTISDLQPNTTYRVGVGVLTAGSEGRCRDFIPVRTRPADSKKTTLTLSFLLLGLVGGVLIAASAVHICKKRVKEVLCPPLPDPADTEAVKILARSELGQVDPRQGFMQPLEPSSPTEPLTLEPRSPCKEDPAAGTAADFPALANPAEETLLPKEDQPGSGDLLPSEYKGQGFLSPMEDDRQGRATGRLQ